METELHGERLLALRKLRGITQDQMATDLGVSGSFVSQLTKGRKNFPEQLAADASAKYRVPMSFFTVVLEPADVGPVTFSKSSSASVRDENRVVQLYTEAARLFRKTSEASDYRQADLPVPSDYERDPELIAAAVRQADGLGPVDPVRNVTRLCERLGVGVVHDLDSAADDSESQHSGASRPTWFTTRPLITLARADLNAATKRFTVAHELHHVIADRGLQESIKLRRDPREKACDYFARALLVPPAAARKSISETLTLQGYLRLKAEYGISVGALIKRGRDLRLISETREKSLYIQWSSQGWMKNEPVPVADERPLLLGQALVKVHGARFIARASHVSGVEAELIHRWIGPAVQERDDVAEVIELAKRRRN